MSRHIYQPLHPTVRPLLDPQYVAFHDAHMQYVQTDDSKVWDGSARTRPSLPPGTLDVIPVGKTEDIDVPTLDGSTTFSVRAFAPTSPPPPSGYPIFLWCHGGGWAIGGIESENDFCTRVCEGAGVIVCSVGYRLAPEDRFPAAVDDAYAALAYVSSEEGARRIGGDASRVAVGGTSAGANLSCVAALRQIEALGKSSSLKGCLCIVPVVDNTATADTVWKPNTETAPWLTPCRMIWYRKMYMPDENDWSNWHASPNLAPEELLKKMPPTWMAVSEQDLLATEGIAFSKQLQGLGVKTELQVLTGCTHSILALDG